MRRTLVDAHERHQGEALRANGRAPEPAGPLPEHELLGLQAQQLLEMLEIMLRARTTDERQWILQRQGKQAFHISCQGHEGSGVGTAYALDPTRDWIAPYYRSLAATMVFGLTPRDTFLAGLAKADDPSTGGRQMPAHAGPRHLHMLTSGSCVATQIPHAAGAALACKVRGDGGVAVAYFGEGASSKGDFHEGLNFAAIHKLPVIFVCENNHYAISVPMEKQMAVRSVADRGSGYGMPGVRVDGTDPVAVYGVMRHAVERARSGYGPTLIESNVVRLTPHSSDDDDRRYRPESEREDARQHDPVARFADYLCRQGILDAGAESAMRARIAAEVDRAFDEAELAADPDPSTAFDHVYAGVRAVDFRARLQAGPLLRGAP